MGQGRPKTEDSERNTKLEGVAAVWVITSAEQSRQRAIQVNLRLQSVGLSRKPDEYDSLAKS